MGNKQQKLVQTVLITIFIFLSSIILLNSPGTTDVNTWAKWIHNAETYGLVYGYKVNHNMYPPLTIAILEMGYKVFSFFGTNVFYSIKLTILCFLCATSIIFWFWTRKFLMTFVFHVSFLLNSMALGYLDILFGPSLILSLWFLKNRRYLFFTIFFTISTFIKWQPVIIAPFVALYLLNPQNYFKLAKIKLKTLILNIIIPLFVILSIFFVIFSPNEVLIAFIKGTRTSYLGGLALNFSWVMTFLARIINPTQYGRLDIGQISLIETPSLTLVIIAKAIFL